MECPKSTEIDYLTQNGCPVSTTVTTVTDYRMHALLKIYKKNCKLTEN